MVGDWRSAAEDTIIADLCSACIYCLAFLFLCVLRMIDGRLHLAYVRQAACHGTTPRIRQGATRMV